MLKDYKNKKQKKEEKKKKKDLRTFFFPELQRSVKASSLEEALEKVKKIK